MKETAMASEKFHQAARGLGSTPSRASSTDPECALEPALTQHSAGALSHSHSLKRGVSRPHCWWPGEPRVPTSPAEFKASHEPAYARAPAGPEAPGTRRERAAQRRPSGNGVQG
ncbi:unnamed protein product [Gulo gulo]|uniref:Uncharacterized protein n=1 Tax=Gulo gulo TaxID=48420 RepID=A0A9X9LGQ8_GULGU|nr:unnamed protein product [Gulo gulo]